MENKEKYSQNINNQNTKTIIVEYIDDDNYKHRSFISNPIYLKYIQDRYYDVEIKTKENHIDFS